MGKGGVWAGWYIIPRLAAMRKIERGGPRVAMECWDVGWRGGGEFYMQTPTRGRGGVGEAADVGECNNA